MAVSQRQYEAMVALASRQGTTSGNGLAADRDLLSEAVCLARRGRFGDATAVLTKLPADSALRPSMLDLKAKMFAQRGRYLEAEACWREALTLAPDHDEFQQALAAIAEERRYPFWLRIAVSAVVAAVTSAVLLLAAIGLLRWAGWIGG